MSIQESILEDFSKEIGPAGPSLFDADYWKRKLNYMEQLVHISLKPRIHLDYS